MNSSHRITDIQNKLAKAAKKANQQKTKLRTEYTIVTSEQRIANIISQLAS